MEGRLKPPVLLKKINLPEAMPAHFCKYGLAFVDLPKRPTLVVMVNAGN